jgi:hypothetical protein
VGGKWVEKFLTAESEILLMDYDIKLLANTVRQSHSREDGRRRLKDPSRWLAESFKALS